MQFQDNIQSLSRAHEVFREEIDFAHRQYVQDHIKEQRLANFTLNQIALRTKENADLQSEGKEHGFVLLPSHFADINLSLKEH